MRRRELFASLAGAAIWPLVAEAQQPAMPVIGFLNGGTVDTRRDRVVAFLRGLAEAGFVEGRETRTIPIVFVAVGDPVGSGFVAGLPRPGANITGFGDAEQAISDKWLELLVEIAPGIKRVAIMSCGALRHTSIAPKGTILRPFEWKEQVVERKHLKGFRALIREKTDRGNPVHYFSVSRAVGECLDHRNAL
jgi:ABC transporter substrate binding protein